MALWSAVCCWKTLYPPTPTPTSWSRCECRPSRCGPRWRWAAWRRSRFSVPLERYAGPSPRPSARGSARSCREAAEVWKHSSKGAGGGGGPPASQASHLILYLQTSHQQGGGPVAITLRLANKTTPHAFLFFFLFSWVKTTCWDNGGENVIFLCVLLCILLLYLCLRAEFEGADGGFDIHLCILELGRSQFSFSFCLQQRQSSHLNVSDGVIF